jgi:hypothetical protein
MGRAKFGCAGRNQRRCRAPSRIGEGRRDAIAIDHHSQDPAIFGAGEESGGFDHGQAE